MQRRLYQIISTEVCKKIRAMFRGFPQKWQIGSRQQITGSGAIKNREFINRQEHFCTTLQIAGRNSPLREYRDRRQDVAQEMEGN